MFALGRIFSVILFTLLFNKYLYKLLVLRYKLEMTISFISSVHHQTIHKTSLNFLNTLVQKD